VSKNVLALRPPLARLGALALLATGVLSIGPAAADPGLDALAGTWRGSGTMSFEDGKTEGIGCTGYYKGARSLSVVIRCKGISSDFELRSKLEANGDQVSGTWEERTYSASGLASGTTSAGKLDIRFSGTLTGGLELSFSSSSQSVSVSVDTKGAGIKGIRLSLGRI
jgi:hypothetical protein